MKGIKWKDRATQQAALFWAALGLFIYYGIARFGPDVRIFGLVSAILLSIIPSFSGRRKKVDSQKGVGMDASSESDTKYSINSNLDPVDPNNFRNRGKIMGSNERYEPSKLLSTS